jgi:hypothetical protein
MLVGVKQAGPIAVRYFHHMVDEVTRLSSSSSARSELLETVEITTQDPFDLSGGGTSGWCGRGLACRPR